MKHASLFLLSLFLFGSLPAEAAGFKLKEAKLKNGMEVLYPDMLKVSDDAMLQQASDVAKSGMDSQKGTEAIDPSQFGINFMASLEKGDKFYLQQVLMIQGVLTQEQLKAVKSEEKKQMGQMMMQQMASSSGIKPLGFVKSMPPDVLEANGVAYFRLAFDGVDQANKKQSFFIATYYTEEKTVIVQMILPTSVASGHLSDIQRVLGSLKMPK